MLEIGNNRLKVIFTAWFFVIAIIPSLLVGLASYTLQRDQLFSAVSHELRTVVHIKSEFIEHYFAQIEDAMRESSESYSQTQVIPEDLLSRIDAEAAYVVSETGTRLDAIGAIEGLPVWTPDGTLTFKQSEDYLFIAEPLVLPAGWLVAVLTHESYARVLHEHINSTQLFSQNSANDAYAGLGTTADFFLIDSFGAMLTSSVYDVRAAAMMASPEINELLRNGISSYVGQATIFGNKSLVSLETIDLGSQEIYAVSSISTKEVLSRVYDNQRNLLAIYLFSLVGVFIIMYLFVANLGTVLITPIFKSIQSLINSSAKLRESVESGQESLLRQTDVASKLSDAYQEQVDDIKKVDSAITNIVDSLSSISNETKVATKNAEFIEGLANDGKKEASAATSSLETIEQIAIAHDTLVESLQTYSHEVERVATDVRNIAKAISYLSLNAGIEAEKPSQKLDSLSSIAAEVGKLAQMSDRASIHINELVATIQKQLSETKQTVTHERSEAKQSIVVVNRALSVLQKMSKDALQISTSVKRINDGIQRQSENAYEIVVQSHQLMKKSKEGTREVKKLRSLIKNEKEVVRSNVSVVRKLVDNIKGLKGLIGSKNNNGDEKT